MVVFFFFKQKTAYEMRISDWSSDVCSSDLYRHPQGCRASCEALLSSRPHWQIGAYCGAPRLPAGSQRGLRETFPTPSENSFQKRPVPPTGRAGRFLLGKGPSVET